MIAGTIRGDDGEEIFVWISLQRPRLRVLLFSEKVSSVHAVPAKRSIRSSRQNVQQVREP